MHIRTSLLTTATLLAAALAGAQAPIPAPTPTPSPAPVAPGPAPVVAAPAAVPAARPPGATPAAPAEAACDPAKGDVCVNAERLRRNEKDHLSWEGFVDLQFGDGRIQAEQLDLYTETKPDGTTSRRVVADGQRRLPARRGAAVGREARDGPRRPARARSRTPSATRSPACSWRRRASSAWTRTPTGSTAASSPPAASRTRAGDFAPPPRRSRWTSTSPRKNVVFRVKRRARPSTCPTSSTRSSRTSARPASSSRTSGNPRVRGFNIGGGFFWAMGRSLDQTFYLDHYPKYGYGFGHELRYALPPAVARQLPHLLLPAHRGRRLGARLQLDGGAAAARPGAGEPAGAGDEQHRRSSSRSRTAWTSPRGATRRSSLSLQRAFGATTSAAGATRPTLLPGGGRHRLQVTQRHLPLLQVVGLAPEESGAPGSSSATRRAGRTSSNGDQDGSHQVRPLRRATRACRAPSRCPSSSSPRRCRCAAPATPRRDVAGAGTTGGPHRPASIWRPTSRCAAPTSRSVFDTRGQLLLGPLQARHRAGGHLDLAHGHRPRGLPGLSRSFDGVDWLVGTNEVRYALVQRFYAKRPGTQRQAGALRVLQLARVADLLRGHRDASQLRPELQLRDALPGARRGRPGDALLAAAARGCASGPSDHANSSFTCEYDVNPQTDAQHRPVGAASSTRRSSSTPAGRAAQPAVDVDPRAAQLRHDPRRLPLGHPAGPAGGRRRAPTTTSWTRSCCAVSARAALRRPVLRLHGGVIQLRLQSRNEERQFRFSHRAREHRLDRQFHGPGAGTAARLPGGR